VTTGESIVAAIYNGSLLGGTAYLVGWHGWSPWWFLLAVICMFGASSKENN
jgi:hypothetical protein